MMETLGLEGAGEDGRTGGEWLGRLGCTVGRVVMTPPGRAPVSCGTGCVGCAGGL